MKTVRVHSPGGPEALSLDDLPDPVPGPGQAVVRVEAAGVNYIDTYQRSGLYPLPLPAALGLEGAGVVEAVGEGVTAVLPGQRVAWARAQGSYAEKVLAPADVLVAVPAAVPTRVAAAVMLQGMTAHYLACSTRPLGPGDTCLVHAAAGGVGLLLCQIARRRGARVLGTVSTDEKAALAREAGCDDPIVYTRVDFAAEARRLTGGRGVEVVYDGVGRDTFARSLDALALRGMLVLFGGASGPVPPFDPQVLNQKGSLYLTRPALHHHVHTRSELVERASDVLGWVADGSLAVRIDRDVPLADAAEAHRALEGRGTAGKVLIGT